MDVIIKIALFFHLVGFASLFGVAAVQIRSPLRIAKNGMMHGALTQLVSGAVLAGSAWNTFDHRVIAAKAAILLVILGILAYYRRDSARVIPPKPFFAVFILTLTEAVIAVVWLQGS